MASREIVHHAAPIEQEHEPDLYMEQAAEAATDRRAPGVETLAELELVPHTAHEQKPGAISQIRGIMQEPERGSLPLHMRPGWDTMISRRLGASLREECSVRNSRSQYGIQAVCAVRQLQDPG